MKKFRVTETQTGYYVWDVEANSEQEALDLVEEGNVAPPDFVTIETLRLEVEEIDD